MLTGLDDGFIFFSRTCKGPVVNFEDGSAVAPALKQGLHVGPHFGLGAVGFVTGAADRTEVDEEPLALLAPFPVEVFVR